jgi:hypothetical protein
MGKNLYAWMYESTCDPVKLYCVSVVMHPSLPINKYKKGLNLKTIEHADTSNI